MNHSQIILGLETSTHACSVGLSIDGQYFSRQNIEPKKHSELILPMIQSLLKEAKLEMNDLTALAVGVGPGSFTGVRVAVGLAKAFGFALNIPVWPISSLRALAHQVQRTGQCDDPQAIILSTWDARMQAIYWGLYQSSEQNFCAIQNQADQLCAPHELDLSGLTNQIQRNQQSQLVAVGCGISHYYDSVMGVISQYQPKIMEDYYPDAQDVIELAIIDRDNGLQPANVFDLAPEYVRNDVAKVPKNLSHLN